MPLYSYYDFEFYFKFFNNIIPNNVMNNSESCFSSAMIYICFQISNNNNILSCLRIEVSMNQFPLSVYTQI